MCIRDRPILGVETSSRSKPLLGEPAACVYSVHPVVAFSDVLPAVISGNNRQVVPPPGQEHPAGLPVLHCAFDF